VALARALAVEPGVLLFDEPLSNLDRELRESTRAQIRALQQRLGITALYVTHDQDEALALSDRIAVLRRGRLVAEGTPEALYAEPPTAYVAQFLGGANVVRGPLAEALRGRALGPGQALVVRPEDLEPAVADSSDEGTVPARLVARQFLGREALWTVEASGATLTLVAPALASPPESLRLRARRATLAADDLDPPEASGENPTPAHE
jgi:ABC-type Fe3+/spermidine/putrescine transport system ATPase subunit